MLIHYPENKDKTWLFVSNIGHPIIKPTVEKVPKLPLIVHPFFSAPSRFYTQTRSAPRKVKYCKFDSESRSLATQKRLEQVDIISSWKSLIEFYHKLNVKVVSKNDSIINIEVAEIPPWMLFSLETFKDYTISSFKGNT